MGQLVDGKYMKRPDGMIYFYDKEIAEREGFSVFEVKEGSDHELVPIEESLPEINPEREIVGVQSDPDFSFNWETTEDKDALFDYAQETLGMEIHKRCGIETIRAKVAAALEAKGRM